MNLIATPFEGLFVIEPKVFEDERGYFLETFNNSEFEKNGLFYNFLQDNQSFSKYGVIRGLHYQTNPFAQAKLVRVLQGSVLDVVVDLRRNSATFGQHYSVELSAENFKQLLVPRGFAHGFSVLSDTAVFVYKCDNLYNKACERSIIFNDTFLNINWRVPVNHQIVSQKDLMASTFELADKF